VSEIAGEEEKMVGDGLGLAAPFGHQTRGERVSKIRPARPGPGAVAGDAAGDLAEGIIQIACG